jgi:anti-anti-sigma factor
MEAPMFEYTITEECGAQCIVAKGRIDALSAPDVRKGLDQLVLAGQRVLIIDMTMVSYVSSAGLRVFLAIQKQLKKVEGEVIFLGMSPQVLDVFKMSGLTTVFRTIEAKNDLAALFDEECVAQLTTKTVINGLAVEYSEGVKEKGSLFTIGSSEKLAGSSYAKEDVASVKAWGMQHGCGFGTVGDDYEEYKGLFGESLVANGNFFYYPAVKHPSVDFVINAQRNPAAEYRFLHGFGFNGPYLYTASFDCRQEPTGLDSLMSTLLTISGASAIGVVMVAESKGLWAMHLKKVPLIEQRPENGKPIFDPANFAEWVDFPVEPAWMNHVVVAVGIAVKDRRLVKPDMAALIAEGDNCHIHGCIFDGSPLSKDTARFDEEVLRVFNELACLKVGHLMGGSRFGSGMAAIVELEE